ncbi:MAG: hypothetical protein IK100_11935 [Muribaculaceae bacterium]|nr:hypothetical protein [Muribaculaceae bacterium]
MKDEPQEAVAPLTWSSFISKHSMVQLPDILANVLSRVPAGYEMAMLALLLSALGALCFSKVRAKYCDGKIHSPNLMLIIEGNWGTGKEKFNQMFQYLFRDIINRDKSMLSKDGAIIQYAGINASQSKFIDTMAGNQGVHIFAFSSEIVELINSMKKANGITFEHIRKAFDNGEVGRQNKSKDIQGLFPVYMNAAFTGTPGDVNKFISKELEGGSASRFIWSTIPDAGRVLESLSLPEDDEIRMMRDQIMEWNERYCHKTINGVDVAANEYHVNLGYINDALDNWIKVTQCDHGREDDPARKGARGRMACIAFHAAIVLHMLYGEPTDAATKQVIVDLTLLIADYCMERFLEKFGAQQRALHVASNHKAAAPSSNKNDNYSGGLPKETVVAMYELYMRSPGMGYASVGRAFGLTGDCDRVKYTVKNAINKYKKEEGL